MPEPTRCQAGPQPQGASASAIAKWHQYSNQPVASVAFGTCRDDVDRQGEAFCCTHIQRHGYASR
jgi:hypothetical protein